ncbi:MAG TPA: hypothetical protein VM487_18525 [Phycisphaerae bacterium]|nr:hypothetical protein [Phycisphaerae bacterium]HUW32636.1 hypothetical protein [Planctomycetota bacterium]
MTFDQLAQLGGTVVVVFAFLWFMRHLSQAVIQVASTHLRSMVQATAAQTKAITDQADALGDLTSAVVEISARLAERPCLLEDTRLRKRAGGNESGKVMAHQD